MGHGSIAPVPKRGHGLTMIVNRSIRTRGCRDRGKWTTVSVEAEATKRTRKSMSSRPRTLSSNECCKEDTQGTHQRRQDRVHHKRITKSWNGGRRFLVHLTQPEVLRHRRRAAPGPVDTLSASGQPSSIKTHAHGHRLASPSCCAPTGAEHGREFSTLKGGSQIPITRNGEHMS